jgi:hypothetical protein
MEGVPNSMSNQLFFLEMLVTDIVEGQTSDLAHVRRVILWLKFKKGVSQPCAFGTRKVSCRF